MGNYTLIAYGKIMNIEYSQKESVLAQLRAEHEEKIKKLKDVDPKTVKSKPIMEINKIENEKVVPPKVVELSQVSTGEDIVKPEVKVAEDKPVEKPVEAPRRRPNPSKYEQAHGEIAAEKPEESKENKEVKEVKEATK